jgi:hypothetical protein
MIKLNQKYKNGKLSKISDMMLHLALLPSEEEKNYQQQNKS